MMKNLINGVVLVGGLSVFSSHAAILYLSDAATDDSRDCKSAAAACKTLSGVYGKANAGDEIYIAEGTYSISTPYFSMSKAVTLSGGYSADFNKRTGDATKTTITTGGSAGFDRLFYLNTGTDAWLTFDTLTLTGLSNADTKNGAILTHGSGALLALNNVVMEGNVMQAGSGAVEMALATDKLKITKSKFVNNEGKTANGGAVSANGGYVEIGLTTFTGNKAPAGGAVNMNGGMLSLTDGSFDKNQSTANAGAINLVATTADINRVVLSENTSVQQGGAISLDAASVVSLQNATFYKNTVDGAEGSRGAAVAVNGGTLVLNYSTFYNNEAAEGGVSRNAGALSVWGAGSKVNLFGNLFLDNRVGSVQSNIAFKEGTITDKGSNIFGYAVNDDADDDGLWKINADLSKTATDQMGLFGTEISTTLTNTDIADIIKDVDGPVDNGGTTTSIKLAIASPARDKIASNRAAYYGLGKNTANPFVSLQQAHSAMKVFKEYAAGTYHFNLDTDGDGSGDGAVIFSTYINKDGWVLVASGDKSTPVAAGAYAAKSALSLRSDSILEKSIVAHAAFLFDEVRINTPAGSNVALDMISSQQGVLDALKAYNVLPNNFSGGNWLATNGGLFIDGATAAASTNTLDKAIFDATNDVDALSWLPATNDDVVTKGNGTAIKENMDLWVRVSNHYCDGTKVSTDGRGLHRADYKNPNDIYQADDVKFCDIGAFEFNNGYRLDCHDEDGKRSENNFDLLGTGEVKIDICIGGDLDKITPKALLDNLGAFHPAFYLVLLSVLGLRLRKQR